MRGYDLSLDSQRFLMVKFGERKSTPVTELMVVQNWFEELKRLVPTGSKTRPRSEMTPDCSSIRTYYWQAARVPVPKSRSRK